MHVNVSKSIIVSSFHHDPSSHSISIIPPQSFPWPSHPIQPPTLHPFMHAVEWNQTNELAMGGEQESPSPSPPFRSRRRTLAGPDTPFGAAVAGSAAIAPPTVTSNDGFSPGHGWSGEGSSLLEQALFSYTASPPQPLLAASSLSPSVHFIATVCRVALGRRKFMSVCRAFYRWTDYSKGRRSSSSSGPTAAGEGAYVHACISCCCTVRRHPVLLIELPHIIYEHAKSLPSSSDFLWIACHCVLSLTAFAAMAVIDDSSM